MTLIDFALDNEHIIVDTYVQFKKDKAVFVPCPKNVQCVNCVFNPTSDGQLSRLINTTDIRDCKKALYYLMGTLIHQQPEKYMEIIL